MHSDKNWDFSQIDIKSPIDKIPVKSNTFDYIILTQVLEHVENPKEVMTELARVLKPNGKILCSVPQCFGEHQPPYNFYNYVRYGLYYLAKEADLKIIYIEPMGGYFTLMGQMASNAPALIFGNGIAPVVFFPFRVFISGLGLWLDKFDKEKTTTAGYLVIFKKQVK